MKLLLLMLSIFFNFYAAEAQMLQVPEDCLATKTAPCLAHVKTFVDKPIEIASLEVSVTAETIMKWTSFEGKVAVELIKGKMHIRRLTKAHVVATSHKDHELKETHKEDSQPVAEEETLTVNDILVKDPYVMIHKDNDSLKIFELKDFMVSEYDVTDSKQPPILQKSHFADKSELVFLSAPFFKSKNKLLAFLKSIEERFQSHLQTQAESQTNVLKRALASVEEENKEAVQKRAAEEAKLKKVRELFFFRTFYR